MDNFKWFILGCLTAILVLIIYNNNRAYGGYEYEVDDSLSLQEYTGTQVIEDEEIYPYQEQKEKLMQFEAIDESFAEGLIELCNKYTDNLNLCLSHIIGVATPESSTFKRCSSGNNCFGLMSKKGLKRYESKLQGVEDWLQTYVRLGWSTRTTAQAWLDKKYCASACTNRARYYTSAVNKLGL